MPAPDSPSTGNTVEFSARDLPPRTPVTLRAGVDLPTPARADPAVVVDVGPDPRPVGAHRGLASRPVRGRRRDGLPLVPDHRRTRPRLPRAVRAAAGPRTGADRVHPHRERAEHGLTATLFYLAERKLVDLRQVSADRWTIRGIAERGAWAGRRPGQRRGRLHAEGDEFGGRVRGQADEEVRGEAQQGQDRTWRRRCRSGPSTRGWWSSARRNCWVRSANALALILAVCGFLRWGFPTTLWGLPFAVFFAFTVKSWADGVGMRRTPAGRQLWSQAGGFHRLLATDSAETRFDFAARKDLYTAYVPFAVAAGAAALWAKKYQDATGAVAPQPDWYHSSSTGSSGFSGGLGWGRLRQLRLGAVVVDQRLHRIAVVVVLEWRWRRFQRWWWRRRRWRRRRLVVSALLVLVLVLAGAGVDRIRAGLQQDSHRRRPGGRGAVRYRRRADPARVADPQPGADGADVRRPREGHPRPRHRMPARR